MPKFTLDDVLIVDDSPSQLQLLAELCQQLPLNRIRTARHGEEALHAMRQQRPSLLLLDLEMPRLDGVQVLQRMAREGLVMPVVVASAKDPMLIATVELMGRELGLPVLGALKKPIRLHELSDLLNRACHRQQAATDEALCTDSAIRVALDRGEIVPYYQPKVTLHGQLLKGAELLARWPQGDDVISPSRFIPVIESCGWSSELTLQMLQHGLHQWQQWARRGLRLPMSINLSALAMRGDELVGRIEQQVAHSKVPPRFIIFEITETAVADDLAAAIGMAARLRLAGFGLSIDDFGTGFATMQQLVRFPFTELKIDQSLVQSISNKTHLENVVHSVIELAKRMNLTTVAEGIETEGDQLCLGQRGCQLGQGYLYTRPLPPAQFEHWIRQRRQTDPVPA
ncbi:MAG: EAL domain-containing protein [Vogesella sp.]|uniref:EAL domain-containing response regulator n=1 Tax=Vogesella sp. TaxID=1904252 RepID=UPI00391B468B